MQPIRIIAGAGMMLSFFVCASVAHAEKLVSVVIDNAVEARNYQQGLGEAPIVFEEVAEDGQSRLLVFFDVRALPDLIGPAEGLTPRLVEVLGPTAALTFATRLTTDGSSMQFVNVTDVQSEYERTPPGRKRGQLFVRAPNVRKLLRDVRIADGPWPIAYEASSSTLPSEVSASRVEVVVSNPKHNLLFTYDPKEDAYTRSLHGAPERGSIRNVVVLVSGGGLYLLQEGTVSRGSRPSLLPGQTWVVFAEDVRWQDKVLPALSGAESLVTDDESPVLFADREPGHLYVLSLMSDAGERIESQSIRTDESGMILYTPEQALKPGRYYVLIRDQMGFEANTFSLTVSDDTSTPTPWVITFGRKGEERMIRKTDGTLVVGGVERVPGQVIQGYVRPGETVAVEFHSVQRIVQAVADERGYFELPIPVELALGEHTARLLHLSAADKMLAKDLLFSFALLPGAFEIAQYDLKLVPWHVRNASLLLQLCLLALGLHLLLVSFSHVRWGMFRSLRVIFPFAPSQLQLAPEVITES